MTPFEVRRDFDADVASIRETHKEHLKNIRARGIKRPLEWEEVFPVSDIRWWLDQQEGCHTWPSLEEDHQYIALREAYADKIDACLKEEEKSKASLFLPVGQDVCGVCGAVFTAFTLMWPCSNGCCRAAIVAWKEIPEFHSNWSYEFHDGAVFRGNTLTPMWTHNCAQNRCSFPPEYRQEVANIIHDFEASSL